MIRHFFGTEHKTDWMKKASDGVTGLDGLSLNRLLIKGRNEGT